MIVVENNVEYCQRTLKILNEKRPRTRLLGLRGAGAGPESGFVGRTLFFLGFWGVMMMARPTSEERMSGGYELALPRGLIPFLGNSA